jgi:TatD DNase family protein
MKHLAKASVLPAYQKHGKFTQGQMVKGTNESCTIERLARIAAGVKGIPLEEVAGIAWSNSIKMFTLG